MSKPTFRMVVIADCHFGSLSGYPHPDLFRPDTTPEGQLQRALKAEIDSLIDEFKGADLLVVNGDAIDGKGPKTGGNEQASTDRLRQCELMADELVRWEASKIMMTYGTGYHTGKEEDFEYCIAKLVGAEIQDVLSFEIYNTLFDIRHFISPSSVPNSRPAALAREISWEKLSAMQQGRRAADVLIRSHAHYSLSLNLFGCAAYITPALCSRQTKFGRRKCTGTVDFGILVFDIEPGNKCSAFAAVKPLAIDAPKTIKLR